MGGLRNIKGFEEILYLFKGKGVELTLALKILRKGVEYNL